MNLREWALNLPLFPSTRKSTPSLCNWKRMGHPAVLLSPVRGKLQSLQCSVLIGPSSVSWNPSRSCPIGLSLHCEDFPASQHLLGSVPLPLPTSCCSQSAYSAVCACVCLSSPFPLFPLQNSRPSLLSTPIPPSLTHSHSVLVSHMHTLVDKHSHTPATRGPAVAWCVWVSGESYTSVFVCVCVCVINAAASLQQISASLGIQRERGDIEVHHSWIRDSSQGNNSLISSCWCVLMISCHCDTHWCQDGKVWFGFVRLVSCRRLIQELWQFGEVKKIGVRLWL